MYVYCIESLAHVQSYSNYACRGCHLIEFPGYWVVDVMECSGCGVEFFEAVLCVDLLYVCDVWNKTLFQSAVVVVFVLNVIVVLFVSVFCLSSGVCVCCVCGFMCSLPMFCLCEQLVKMLTA